MFRKSEEREFSAHHMLLHAAELEITAAEAHETGRFNKCLAAMAMTALAVEALLNAVGKRVVTDWPGFERLRPYEKLDVLVEQLSLVRGEAKEPWTTLGFLGSFRNDIAHPKPEPIASVRILPEVGLARTSFDRPLSALEKVITVGNARQAYCAVHALKGLLTDGLPSEKRFGIYVDAWSGTTSKHEP